MTAGTGRGGSAAESGLALLEDWLHAVETLASQDDAECLAGAAVLVERRADWIAQLEASPPSEGVPARLAERLLAAERGLDGRLGGILDRLREQLGDVHEAQRAHAGYRPQRERVPAYVSRQV